MLIKELQVVSVFPRNAKSFCSGISIPLGTFSRTRGSSATTATTMTWWSTTAARPWLLTVGMLASRRGAWTRRPTAASRRSWLWSTRATLWRWRLGWFRLGMRFWRSTLYLLLLVWGTWMMVRRWAPLRLALGWWGAVFAFAFAFLFAATFATTSAALGRRRALAVSFGMFGGAVLFLRVLLFSVLLWWRWFLATLRRRQRRRGLITPRALLLFTRTATDTGCMLRLATRVACGGLLAAFAWWHLGVLESFNNRLRI